jgi:regulatory protein
VSFEGKPDIKLEPEVVIKSKIKVGTDIDDTELIKIRHKNRLEQGYKMAIQLLGYRPRSETEISKRLCQRHFTMEEVQDITKRLKEEDLLDDKVFAIFWRDNRISFRPRSSSIIRMELKQKGISREIIEEVTANIDDHAMARRAACKKAYQLKGLEFNAFRRRITDFLIRRGFNYTVALETTKNLWSELGQDGAISLDQEQ